MVKKVLIFIVLLGIFIALPTFASTYSVYLISLIAVYAILGVGLDLVMGCAGQISIANAAFFAIGAYAGTLLTLKLGLPFWLSLPSGGVIAGVVGFLVGIPALRLSGHYLALATLGFNIIVELLIIHWVKMTNGPVGLRVPIASIGSLQLKGPGALFYLIIPVSLSLIVFARNIMSSRIGRAFFAIKETEIAASSMGIDLARYKTFAFALSAFYAGIAGGLYAILVTFISPETFGVWESVFHITIIVVGGLGTVIGAIYGSIILILIPEMLRRFQEYREIIYGIFLLVFIIFIPGGISGIITTYRSRLSMLHRKRKGEE